MIDYIYEVRFPNNPDPTFTQKFSDRKEAEACHAEYDGSELYLLELDYDDYTGMRGIGHLVSEIKLEDDLQPEEAPVDDKPSFRAPVLDDDLDDMDENLVEAATDEEDDIPDDFDGIMDYLQADEDEAISGYEKAMDKVEDEFVKDQLNKIATEEEAHKDYLAKVVDDHTIEYTEPLEPEDDMTDEELGEALFSALSQRDLDEDAAGTIDDPVEGEELCAWCGEAIPVDSLKFVDGVGLICARCQAALKAHAEDDSLKL